jgi:hypothetical protein
LKPKSEVDRNCHVRYFYFNFRFSSSIS